MPKTSKDDSPNLELLDEFVRGAQRAAALQAALQLDLFTQIAEGNHSIPVLLRETNWNERGARILLDALVYLGLLTKQLNEYMLTPTSETFLVKNKAGYIGEALLTRLAWDAREQLPRVVKSGKPAQHIFSEPFEQARAQRAATALLNAPNETARAQALWGKLGWTNEQLANARVLGIACGSARQVLALLSANPNARAALLDSPPVLAVAKNLAEALQVTARVTFQEDDLLNVTWQRGSFELAWIGGKTQYHSLMQNIGVLRHVFEALTEEGRIVVEAPMSDDAHRGPGAIPLHGLDVLLSSAEGDIYTTTEYRGMLEAAGFFQVESIKDEPTLMVARRMPPTPPQTIPPNLTESNPSASNV